MESNYYNLNYIKFLLLENTKHRDFSVLGGNNAAIRALNVYNLYSLDRAFKLMRWEVNKQNLYVSCAKLSNIPNFTFNISKRSTETGPWYREQYNNDMYEMDLLFDFDKEKTDSWENLRDEITDFKGYLDEYKVPYYVIFSGNKGFQFVVDGMYLTIKKVEMGNVFPHKTVIEKVKEALDLKFLDLSNNGVNSRLRKLPYSLVGENVCLPLSDEDFESFSIEKMKLDYVIKNVKLMKRGNLERFSELSLEQKKENVEKFINLFNLK